MRRCGRGVASPPRRLAHEDSFAGARRRGVEGSTTSSSHGEDGFIGACHHGADGSTRGGTVGTRVFAVTTEGHQDGMRRGSAAVLGFTVELCRRLFWLRWLTARGIAAFLPAL